MKKNCLKSELSSQNFIRNWNFQLIFGILFFKESILVYIRDLTRDSIGTICLTHNNTENKIFDMNLDTIPEIITVKKCLFALPS